MPTINSDTCYKTIPLAPQMVFPDDLDLGKAAELMSPFSSGITTALLNKHMGADTTYTHKKSLIDAFRLVLAHFEQPTVSDDEKRVMADKLQEGIGACSPGFHDRVNSIALSLNRPEDIDACLELMRRSIVESVARQCTDEVHLHNGFFIHAAAHGYGVRPMHIDDVYSGDLTAQQSELLVSAFQKRYTGMAILNDLPVILESELRCYYGYQGMMQEGYISRDVQKMQSFLEKILGPQFNLDDVFITKHLQPVESPVEQTAAHRQYGLLQLSFAPQTLSRAAQKAFFFSRSQGEPCYALFGSTIYYIRANVIKKTFPAEHVPQTTLTDLFSGPTDTLQLASEPNLEGIKSITNHRLLNLSSPAPLSTEPAPASVRVLDINWRFVQDTLWKKLRDEGRLIFTDEEQGLFAAVYSQDKQALSSLLTEDKYKALIHELQFINYSDLIKHLSDEHKKPIFDVLLESFSTSMTLESFACFLPQLQALGSDSPALMDAVSRLSKLWLATNRDKLGFTNDEDLNRQVWSVFRALPKNTFDALLDQLSIKNLIHLLSWASQYEPNMIIAIAALDKMKTKLWSIKFKDNNNNSVLMRVICYQPTALPPLLAELNKLPTKKQAAIWAAKNTLGYNFLMYALRYWPSGVPGILTAMADLPIDTRVEIWRAKSAYGNVLAEALDGSGLIELPLMLEALAQLPEDKQVAIWTAKCKRGNSAVCHIARRKAIPALLDAWAQLPQDKQVALWTAKYKYGYNILMWAIEGSPEALPRVLEELAKLPPDTQTKLWTAKSSTGKNALAIAAAYNLYPFPALLIELAKLPLIQQLAVWTAQDKDGNNALALATTGQPQFLFDMLMVIDTYNLSTQALIFKNTKHRSLKAYWTTQFEKAMGSLDESIPIERCIKKRLQTMHFNALSKQAAVLDAISEIKRKCSDDPSAAIGDALQDTTSTLYKALNMRRYGPLSMHRETGSLRDIKAAFFAPSTAALRKDKPSPCPPPMPGPQ